MNVARTFCVVPSCCKRRVARGVAFRAALAKAMTAIDNEKVTTANIDEARMPRIWSAASAPILLLNEAGMSGARA